MRQRGTVSVGVMARMGVNVAGPLSPPCVLMSLSLALSFCEEPVPRGCCSCSFHALRRAIEGPWQELVLKSKVDQRGIEPGAHS